MQFKTVKNGSEIELAGKVSVELTTADGALNSVRFVDESGRIVVVQYTSYAMQVLVPAPPKLKKHRLTGTVAGLTVDELFDDEWGARVRRDELVNEFASASVDDLPINAVEVPEVEQ